LGAGDCFFNRWEGEKQWDWRGVGASFGDSVGGLPAGIFSDGRLVGLAYAEVWILEWFSHL